VTASVDEVIAVTVNELARRAGVAAHVVRYYTQRGLLSPARNSRNSYRDYDETELYRLRFICKVKTIGFTLTEISMILNAANEEVAPLAEICDRMRLRAEQYGKELESAQQLQRTILDVIERLDRSDDGASERVKLQRLIEAVALDAGTMSTHVRLASR
jgi:DNA-binding transcriptional MerR regulator